MYPLLPLRGSVWGFIAEDTKILGHKFRCFKVYLTWKLVSSGLASMLPETTIQVTKKRNKLSSSTQLEHLWMTIANMRHTLRCNKWHLEVDGKQLLSNPIKVHSTWGNSSLELEIQSASQGTEVMNITKVSTITTFLEQYQYYYILKFVIMCTDTWSYHTTPHQKVFSRQLMESIKRRQLVTAKRSTDYGKPGSNRTYTLSCLPLWRREYCRRGLEKIVGARKSSV